MEGKFNPETHRKDFEKAEKEVSRQLANAHESALKDNDVLDEITGKETADKEKEQETLSEGQEFFPVEPEGWETFSVEEKVSHLRTELGERLKELGSPAIIDTFFEGGVVHIALTPELQKKLKYSNSALQAFEEAGNYIHPDCYDKLQNITYTPLHSSFDVVVLNHGQTTQAQREKLVSDMRKAGYSPLSLSQLIALGIVKPELIEQGEREDEVLNTCKEYELGDVSYTPVLFYDGNQRFLSLSEVDGRIDSWSDRNRFLFRV